MDHRSRIVGINVIRHPVKVEVIHVADGLHRTVRQDGFQCHSLAAQMHVGLEILQAGGGLQNLEALRLAEGVWRNVHAGAFTRRTGKQRQVRAVLRFLATR